VTEPQQTVDWDAIYQQEVAGLDGPPGWNIGEPQPALAELIDQGKFRSDVLDAGCGYAEGSLYLAARGYTVVGVDLTRTAVAAAIATAAERGLITATFVQEDITKLHGYDGRFSTVMDSGLLHALPVDLRDAYLSSIHRAAAPGASLFILAFAQSAFPAPPPVGPKPFTEDELRDTVSAHWIVDDIRPAFLHAHVPEGIPLPDDVEHDDKGRVKGPAWLLTGHKAA
jgi:SAM-dependent methyltransferase